MRAACFGTARMHTDDEPVIDAPLPFLVARGQPLAAFVLMLLKGGWEGFRDAGSQQTPENPSQSRFRKVGVMGPRPTVF